MLRRAAYYVPACILLLLCACADGVITDPALNGAAEPVALLEAWIPHEELNSLRENRFSNTAAAGTIRLRGNTYPLHFRAAGSGSRNRAQWSYRLILDGAARIDLRPGFAVREFNLSAQVQDPSMLRSMLARHIFRAAGFPIFQADYAYFALNGQREGLYLMLERIDADFFARRSRAVHELIQVNFGARFSFVQALDPLESFHKKIPDDRNYNNLTAWIHALDTSRNERIPESLAPFLALGDYLRYHAVASVLQSSDSFRNNFFLYKEHPHSPYTIIPWDFDRTFDPHAPYNFYGENDIIAKLLRNDSCFALYKAEMHYTLDSLFSEDLLFPVVDSLHEHIAAAYRLSPYLGGHGRDLAEEARILKNFIAGRRAQLRTDLPGFTR